MYGGRKLQQYNMFIIVSGGSAFGPTYKKRHLQQTLKHSAKMCQIMCLVLKLIRRLQQYDHFKLYPEDRQ